MIVTFKTQPQGNSGDVTAAYINFLRCVTAIMTAPAGTTALTVNPYTGSNTINTGFNCIVSIDSNTEAGGWTTSSVHNVPSSGNNTPQTYTTIAASAAYLYKADFYKSSGKTGTACQYLKMCFHSYNDFNSSDTWFMSGWGYNQMYRSAVTASAGANMLITYGHSSSTNWTDTAFPPAGTSVSDRFNNTTQNKSRTLNHNNSYNYYNMGPGLAYMDTAVQYKMAVTADYCIIWEELVGVSYATGQWYTPTSGAGTTYWNNSRYGSIYYMGTRDMQAWENTRDDNPNWVAWQTTLNRSASGNGSTIWAPDGMTAFMATLNISGTQNNPEKFGTHNTYVNAYFNAGIQDKVLSGVGNGGYDGYSPGTSGNQAGIGLDPMMKHRSWGNSTIFNSARSDGNSSYLGNIPQIDPITGTWVPGAYPMVVSKSGQTVYNGGGKCRGIYKSLSMPYADMKRFWQSENQTFTIGGETYRPFVIYEDMWLVRVA